MSPRPLAALILAAAALTSCGRPAVKCDADGFIIVGDGATIKERQEWAAQNMQLAVAHMAKLSRMNPDDLIIRGSLGKAKACP